MATTADRIPRPWLFRFPIPRLTPGATILATRLVVCAQANTKNKAVPAELQRKVFEEYGIAGAAPRAYEVDYLVTPALGGADDIRNLWPHSYSATMWNARVKDALEDRLREMVCEGSLDLTEAQQEIAVNWIAAYKKYFHTDNAAGAALQARNSQLDRAKMTRIHSLTLLCGICALCRLLANKAGRACPSRRRNPRLHTLRLIQQPRGN